MGQIPYSVIETLTSSTLLFIFLARIPQIINIYKKKSSGQLSGVSQFLMVAGGLARVFTGLTVKKQKNLLMDSNTDLALSRNWAFCLDELRPRLLVNSMPAFVSSCNICSPSRREQVSPYS